jgi:hypothetical protein
MARIGLDTTGDLIGMPLIGISLALVLPFSIHIDVKLTEPICAAAHSAPWKTKLGYAPPFA